MAYFVGENMKRASGKLRIAEKDIECYLNIVMFDDYICKYDGRLFKKDFVQPRREFVIERGAGGIFITNAYYVKATKFGCNAKFKIPAGAKYYHSSQYNDYIADTVVFIDYILPF